MEKLNSSRVHGASAGRGGGWAAAAPSRSACGLVRVGARAREDMNSESEWKELTCAGPFADLPAEKHSIYRNRQGELTLERPAQGVYASTVERDPEDFEQQYRRAARLQELRQSGHVSPVVPRHSLPAISGPSEASQLLLDDAIEDAIGPAHEGLDRHPLQLEPTSDLEPEPEEEPNKQHARVVYQRGQMHHLGKALWVTGIPDAYLKNVGTTACEKTLWSEFSRFGTVEKVTLREKYNGSTSRQSWAMIGFSDASHDAVDRALDATVILGGKKLEIEELDARKHLSDRSLNDEGKLPEKWLEFHAGSEGPNAYSQRFCCFRKATRSGKWSCQLGTAREKKPLGAVSRLELRAAFQLFDLDGNGAIDAEELSATMLALAKAGRMAAPSDSQIAEMMSEADGDGDGEIDFEEFCALIAACDLHPSTCTRCEQSQYILTEDFYFGEPRPEAPDAGRPETCRARMAAREDKMIHLSFAVVATGAPLQTILVVLGASFWFGLSDQRGDTHIALIAGMASVVMSTFAVTIGCASRPVIRGAFLIYALWEIVLIIAVVTAVGDVLESAGQCEFSSGDGEAAVWTTDACPQLIDGTSTVENAKATCVNSATEGFCEWSDKCSLKTTAAACGAVLPSGTCMLTVDNRCTVADSSAAFRGGGVLDLSGACTPTTACRYHAFLQVVGWLLCIVAGFTLMAIAIILNDSRFPLGLQLNARRQQSMWAVAMQMSMDPSLHSMRQDGNLSTLYGAQRIKSKATSIDRNGAIFGAAVGNDRPPEIVQGSDGTLKLRSRGLGV